MAWGRVSSCHSRKTYRFFVNFYSSLHETYVPCLFSENGSWMAHFKNEQALRKPSPRRARRQWVSCFLHRGLMRLKSRFFCGPGNHRKDAHRDQRIRLATDHEGAFDGSPLCKWSQNCGYIGFHILHQLDRSDHLL